MRIAALIFGLLGVVGSGVLNAKWASDQNEQWLNTVKGPQLLESHPTQQAKYAELDRLTSGAHSLLAGAVLGVLGCAVVMSRKGAVASAVFFIAFVTPIVVTQDGKTAVFTFGLALAALFSFFVKPIRAARRKRAPGIPLGTDMV